MNTNLSEDRKGQIALIVLKKKMAKQPITLDPERFEEHLEEMAAELKDDGVTKDELRSMFEEFVRDSVEKLFAKKAE